VAKKSKIKRMPPDVRALIERLLREDRLSLDEIVAEVKTHFPDAEAPSRSGLHRYKEGFEQLTERMRAMDTMANAVVGELGEGVGDKAGALLAQAITTLAANAALQAHERDDVSIDEIRKLARAAKDAIQTRRISLAERQALEKEARERLQREQSENLDKIAAEQGMTDDQVKFWRDRFLGIG
jgi:hypothetical protein